MLPVTFPSSQALDSELHERFYSRLIYKRNLTQRNQNVLCLKVCMWLFLALDIGLRNVLLSTIKAHTLLLISRLLIGLLFISE